MCLFPVTALHQKVTSTFLPTAVKFHYVFNLRDLSNIFQVLLLALCHVTLWPRPDPQMLSSSAALRRESKVICGQSAMMTLMVMMVTVAIVVVMTIMVVMVMTVMTMVMVVVMVVVLMVVMMFPLMY